ncbi:hypothetical protein [Stygiolobus caldivivus]|uniref:Uncharacterized protein n=1 Tax=Stygiolobus caldivivus TaxID=2824673 RepID=A0A8D5ZHZ9_9CREN|nr:hypothetical protein [Stygiolobus caldivivus]BCU69166.1 hypothetical protein KN1_04630 [Stygiolobus caldivivus]
METSGEKKKYYAVTEIETVEIPSRYSSSKYHEHISSAIDEALKKTVDYLKSEGYEGKFSANVNVFVREDRSIRLIQTVKTKIIVK